MPGPSVTNIACISPSSIRRSLGLDTDVVTCSCLTHQNIHRGSPSTFADELFKNNYPGKRAQCSVWFSGTATDRRGLADGRSRLRERDTRSLGEGGEDMVLGRRLSKHRVSKNLSCSLPYQLTLFLSQPIWHSLIFLSQPSKTTFVPSNNPKHLSFIATPVPNTYQSDIQPESSDVVYAQSANTLMLDRPPTSRR